MERYNTNCGCENGKRGRIEHLPLDYLKMTRIIEKKLFQFFHRAFCFPFFPYFFFLSRFRRSSLSCSLSLSVSAAISFARTHPLQFDGITRGTFCFRLHHFCGVHIHSSRVKYIFQLIFILPFFFSFLLSPFAVVAAAAAAVRTTIFHGFSGVSLWNCVGMQHHHGSANNFLTETEEWMEKKNKKLKNK